MTHYEKMRENYEDAVFYLLMNQLAGKQEKEYNKINEELKNDPTFEVPAEMRKASYRTIKKEFSKAHRATAKRVAWKAFQRVSILIAIVTLLITGALAISPKLQVYALNLALETFDDHTSIRFLSPKTTDVDAILKAEWLPTGYICANSSDDGKMWTFEDGEGHWVILIIEPISVEIGIDTENASLVEEVRIGENRGIYVEKDSEHSIVWGNPDTEQVFTMVSNGLKKLDMEKAAEKISAK